MRQFNRFFILGIFSTLIDFIVYIFFVLNGFNYVVSIVIGYSSGFIFNFFAGRKYIFKNGVKVDSFKSEFKRVLIINLMAVILNIFIVFMLYSYINILDEYSSRVIAIGVVFFWNYFARKIFVYN